MNKSMFLFSAILVGAIAVNAAFAQKEGMGKKADTSKAKAKGGTTAPISYKKDVYPVLKMNCLPCHTEDQMNPSELYLDSYDGLLKGGKHGTPIVPGKADSSILIKKLVAPPPFGDPMPMRRKTQIAADTIAVIKRWINQGAKDN